MCFLCGCLERGNDEFDIDGQKKDFRILEKKVVLCLTKGRGRQRGLIQMKLYSKVEMIIFYLEVIKRRFFRYIYIIIYIYWKVF